MQMISDFMHLILSRLDRKMQFEKWTVIIFVQCGANPAIAIAIAKPDFTIGIPGPEKFGITFVRVQI